MLCNDNNDTIYFDNASTSHPKPRLVSDRIAYYLSHIGASPGRGNYKCADEAHQIVENVRKKIAGMIGAQSSSQVAFTYNATHAANIVIKGLLKPKDHVILSCFEHNAIFRPIHALKESNNISYDIWESDEEGNFDIKRLESLVNAETKLIAINHASNVLGVRAPIEQIANFAKQRNIKVLVDIAQTAGLFPTAFADIADYIVGTAHKCLLGPSGVGFLFVKDSESLTTLYEGGSGNLSASPYQPFSMPAKFEAGTVNYLGIAGLNGSLAYIEELELDGMRKGLMNYTQLALDMLCSFPEIIVYGPKVVATKVPLISFNIKGAFPNEVAYFFAQNCLCVRAGIHCAPLMHKTLKTMPHGTIRLSFGHLNTDKELSVLQSLLKKFINKRS